MKKMKTKLILLEKILDDLDMIALGLRPTVRLCEHIQYFNKT